MPWTIELTPEATRTIARLGTDVERRVVKFLRERLATLDDPRRIGEPLKGARFAGLWRYRVGDYRVLCEIQEHRVTILVVAVGHRSSVYN